MNNLSQYFVSNIHAYPHLSMSHNVSLVILSIAVAIFSSTLALHTTQVVKMAKDKLQRNFVIAIGSLALGLGIWCMHFIGILSMSLPITIRFDYAPTVLSLFPSWLSAAIIFSILSRPKIHRWQLIFSGVLVGTGIGLMHYVGMSALNLDVIMRYNPAMFILSIIVAVLFSIVSIWVRFGLDNTQMSYTKLNTISGVILGLAISCMHYVGMHATYFIGAPDLQAKPELILNTTSLSILLATFAVSGSILVAYTGSLIRFKQLFIKLQENDSKTRAIVDTAVDGIIGINGRGIIQSFNQSAERLFGWKAEEVIGKNINILMPEPYTSHHDGYIHNYLTTHKAKIIGSGREVEGLRKDGSILPMRLAVGRVNTKDEPLFVGFISDITDRKELEKSLRKRAEEARNAASVKTAFLANMSHEIRTPLNAIIGFTDILLETKLTEEQHRHLGTIQRSSKSLLTLLNDILDTTKLEKGSFELEHIDFSLQDVAKQVCASLNLTAQSKGLSLNLEINPSLSPYFKGDPLRIQQVLTNLIGNAIKFTEKGYITLHLYLDDNNSVHIEVKDTGIGMTTTQQKHIFDSFTQADASISRRFGGTGLGTTISKQLVELMHGKLYVESVYGHGSTFHVLLPLETGTKPTEFADSANQITLPPLDILIADDIPQNVQLLKLILERNGHKVTTSNNGDEAFFSFQQSKFDLVLMDIHMPNKDGLQTTREIRTYEHKRGLSPTPVIALTASVMEADKQAAKNAGMNGFAFKPIDPKRLFNEMARVLNIATHDVDNNESAVTDNVIIDWDKGIALWGSRKNLINAIAQFMKTVKTSYPLPKKEDTNIDWDKVKLNVHSIRGAAGNLCLSAVFDYASQLEDIANPYHIENFFILLDQLEKNLSLVEEMPELNEVTAENDDSNNNSSNLSLSEVAQKIDQMIDCAANNEIDSKALAEISPYLNKHGHEQISEAIHQALDQFDFDEVKTLLTQLREQLKQGEHA